MAAGRPREFDYDKALDQAIHVFWKKGYEGTSMPDLTDAMGMNRPSIYAAFGNKEELFRKALERYSENAAVFFRKQLDKPDLRDAIESFLTGAVSSFSCNDKPRGCLSVQGALVGSDEAKTACKEASECREIVVTVLQERFKKALAEGDLATGTDIKELARFYTTIIQGMSVQSAGGATKKELSAIAQHALRALPCA